MYVELHFPMQDPFMLYLKEIEAVMGQRSGIQIRLEAQVMEYFYNNTQPAFAETRLVSQKLKLKFLGEGPYAFKPGMPYFGQVAVSMYYMSISATQQSIEFIESNNNILLCLFHPGDV
jgi:hypothetical protein